jgi:hypothetical protein
VLQLWTACQAPYFGEISSRIANNSNATTGAATMNNPHDASPAAPVAAPATYAHQVPIRRIICTNDGCFGEARRSFRQRSIRVADQWHA